MSQRASKASPPPLHLLFSAALETWCHHLLYVRRVYPSNTFCDSYFLGIRYKANRHPRVVEYISNAVKVAVPALIDRIADEICLEVIDEQIEEIEPNEAGKIEAKICLPSAEFDSSPSDSHERPAKRPKFTQDSHSPHRKINLHPTNLFQNQSQSTQQSMSSLSTTNIPKGSHSQDSKNTDDNQSTSVANLQSEKETGNSTMVYKSYQVLEKFSLYFSPPPEADPKDDPPIPPKETIATKKPLVPLFTRPKRQSRAPKGPSVEELQQQAILADLERGFRNLVLNVSNLNRDRVLPRDSLSFKVVLQVHKREKGIEKALDTGSWYPASAETKTMEAQRRPHMPLYQVVVNEWDINFHMQRKIEQENNVND